MVKPEQQAAIILILLWRVMMVMDVKEETIEMLRALKSNALSTTLDGKEAVVIEDVKMESFIWVINQAISQIKNGKPDWRDC